MKTERLKYSDETVDIAWKENEAFDKAKALEQDYILNERIGMTLGGENRAVHLRLADASLRKSIEAWDEVTPSVAERHRITRSVSQKDSPNKPVETESRGPLRSLKRLMRVVRGLGSEALDQPIVATERPEVRKFDPRHEDIIDYVRRNAVMAGMDTDVDGLNWIVKEARRLQEAFGRDPSQKKKTTYDGYGFKKDTPRVVFQWGQEDMSQRLADDLLYCFGSQLSGEPEELVTEDGVKRISQEYTTSVGLTFVDTRNVYDRKDTEPRGIHSLKVYLPEVDSAEPSV